MFDARAWFIWLLVAAGLTMTVRNPLYTAVLLLVGLVVRDVCGGKKELQLPIGRLGGTILLFTALFNALLVHTGQTVLLRLPAVWPWIGGAITAESAVYGANNGLMLLTLVVIFAAFNSVVSVSELARLTPRALRDVGVVLFIALSYVPETIQQLQRIREAQAIRGHRLRGLRDWQPIVLPLLMSGLERAMGLAEAMVARGYGQTANARQPFWVQVGLLAGLGMAFGGWMLLFWQKVAGWVMMASGAALITVLVSWLGRQTTYTRYRPRPWTWKDGVMIGTAVLPLLLLLLPLPFVHRDTLFYSPFPALALPPFDIVIGFALVLLAFPVFIKMTDEHK